MGKYLDGLPCLSKAKGSEPNKPNKPENDSSLGSLGSPSGEFHKSTAHQPNNCDKGVEAAIRQWLATIGEESPVVIDEVLARCRGDPAALSYFTNRSKEPPY